MKRLLTGLLISLFLVGTSLAEVGWYIPKPHIHVGDEIVYRSDTSDLIEYAEKWGYLTEQLEGEKVINLGGIKVKHLKGNFEPKPFKCESYDNLPGHKQPVEVYVYCRNGKCYTLLFEGGVLEHWNID